MNDAVLYGTHSSNGKTYSVLKMVGITEGKKTHYVPLLELEHNLVQNYWDKGDNYLSPMMVIDLKIKPHYSRIEQTELDYPIIIHREPDGLFYICDGVHRLSKAHMQKSIAIETVEITDDELERCRINNDF